MAAFRKRWHWILALPLVSLITLLFACAPAPAPEPKAAPAPKAEVPAAAPAKAAAPAGKTELIIAQGADVQKFDPHMSTTDMDIKVTFNIFDNLITRGADGKLKPALATEWKALNDTTWQFMLRKGVKFHNGEPLNAETVKFSIGRTSPFGDDKVHTRAVFSTLDRIDVVDEYTVNFVTKVPDPLLPDRLAFYGGQIIPKQYFEKVGADEFNANPVGTGPLKFVKWVKDDYLTLEANNDWWGGKIAFQKVTFKPMPEPAARVAALLKGEADIITKLPPDDVERANKSPNAQALGVPYSGLYVLGTDYRKPWLDNKYFHQALSLAIDRQAIVTDLFSGYGIVPNGIYPNVDWCYDPNLPPMEYNPAKAKQLLQQIGYRGEEIVFESPDGKQMSDKQTAEAMVGMWREVGINVKLEIIEYAVHAQKIREKGFKGMYWSDPTSILMDPDGHAYRMTGPGGTQDYNRENMKASGWDARMQEARSILDQAKRKKLLDEAHQIFLEYLQWIPVIQPVEFYGAQKWIDWKPMANQDLVIEDIKLMR